MASGSVNVAYDTASRATRNCMRIVTYKRQGQQRSFVCLLRAASAELGQWTKQKFGRFGT
jgi:hypothetical protein